MFIQKTFALKKEAVVQPMFGFGEFSYNTAKIIII